MATANRSDFPPVFDAGLPTLDYAHDRDADLVHRKIRQARQQAPIALGSYGPEVLTYELVRKVLRDSRFVMPRGLALTAQGITSGPLWDRAVSNLLNLDGAQHHRLRGLLSKAFTPRSSELLRTLAGQTINELIDTRIGLGHCDIVTDISRPYPIPIICALLGVPRDDWELFSAWTDDIFKLFQWNLLNDAPDILRAWSCLDAYFDEVVAERRKSLADDLISDLIRAEVDGDRLTHDELLMLAVVILTAGTDTTRNQLAAAVEVLADNPDQWTLVSAHPELAADAVEEAICDVELGGVVIPEGTLVVANTAAANRDPAVYGRPDRFDITRGDRPPIQTFGGGTHYCLGTHLARLELAEALVAITRRIANPRRSGPAPWKPVTGVTGPTALPITFDVAPINDHRPSRRGASI
jgi:cytochrome P450